MSGTGEWRAFRLWIIGAAAFSACQLLFIEFWISQLDNPLQKIANGCH